MENAEINGHPRFKLGRDTHSWAVFEIKNPDKVLKGEEPDYRMIKWPGFKPESISACLVDLYVSKTIPKGVGNVDDFVNKLTELQEWLSQHIGEMILSSS